MIGAMPVTKGRWTASVAWKWVLLGLDLWAAGEMFLLHWDDTIVHAASRTEIIHGFSSLPRFENKCPYDICINVTKLMGLIPPLLRPCAEPSTFDLWVCACFGWNLANH